MRELSIKITADNTQAKPVLADTEKQVRGVTGAAADADQQFEKTFKVNLPAVLGVAATAIAALDFNEMVKKSVDATSRIKDAMQRMGIDSAEAVQRLKFAAEQGGSSLGAVDTAINMMSSHLSDGDKGTVKLLDQLGLNLDALRKMKPDEAFLAITDAVRQLPEPMRQSAAMVDLFGRNGSELLPAVRDGFREIGAQAPVMSQAVVDAGDRAGDKIHELDDKMSALRSSALIPLVDWFQQHLPNSVQTGIVAIGEFTPSLESIGIAVLAAGGPKAVLTWLSTFLLETLPGAITGFISSAGAFLVTFFTVTLPEAFLAVISFLGPQGLIAVAVIALGLVWYKWGDDITAVAKKVYTAVKEWLYDKFKQVVGWVGDEVHKITGFFGDMYDKVVGHSYVPDMVDQIGHHFGRLDEVMSAPAKIATDIVNQVFRDLSKQVTGVIDGMLKKIGVDFDGFTSKTLPEFGRKATEQTQSILGSIKDGLMSGLTAGIGEAVSSLLNAGVGALVNHFRGGEEGIMVNPRRDAFLSQFGDPSNKDVGGAGWNLASLLTSLGAGGGGGVLFGNLQNSESMVAFTAAVDNIVRFLGDHDVKAVRGFKFGTKGEYPDFGSGTLAMLHGRERVSTEAEGRAEAAQLSALASRVDDTNELLAGLRRDLSEVIPRLVRDEVLLAGRA